MTPGQIREELASIQERLKGLEEVCNKQKQHRVGYADVGFELVEAWEAVGRALEGIDEMAIGMS